MVMCGALKYSEVFTLYIFVNISHFTLVFFASPFNRFFTFCLLFVSINLTLLSFCSHSDFACGQRPPQIALPTLILKNFLRKKLKLQKQNKNVKQESPCVVRSKQGKT